jgi:hypothetical protein
VCLGAVYFIIRPSDANSVAHFVGIGRGVDVVIYLWVVTSLLIALRLQVALMRTRRDLTELARHLALSERRRIDDALASSDAAATPHRIPTGSEAQASVPGLLLPPPAQT